MTNIILSIWIQNSRSKAQKKLLQSNLFGFKIQGSEKTSSTQPLWIQDSRLRKKLLQSNLLGFKIQDSRLRKNCFNPTCLDSRFKVQGSEKTVSIPPVWIQDSRFKAQRKLRQSNLFGFKIRDSRLKASGFKKFFGDLESYPLGFKKSFWDLESWILAPWIQEFLLGSWMLNLES